MKYRAKSNLHIGDKIYVAGQVYEESEIDSALDMNDFRAVSPENEAANAASAQPEVQGTPAPEAAPAVEPVPVVIVDEAAKAAEETPASEEAAPETVDSEPVL